MAPGTTITEAERALSRAADAINQQFPPGAGAAPFAFLVRPATALADSDRRTLAAPLLTIFAFTGLLFLATCANLAGLMHARLAARRRELAIRQSLGAGRLRLMREWMLECVALALCGGAAAPDLPPHISPRANCAAGSTPWNPSTPRVPSRSPRL